MNKRRETEKIILLCMRHFVLYRYYGIIVLKSQLLRRKGTVTIRSNIKGREPQLPTTLSSPVTKDNFMIIEFSENDKKNFNKASTIQDAYAEWERSLDLSSIPCPSCSAVGCLCRYDHYDRFLICSAEDIDDPARLSILVVKCASCAHHHAVLIKEICPFSTYSYSFILEALYAFYHGKHRYNKASTANDLGITRSRLSSWIEKFRSSAFLSRMATEYMNRSRSFELLELLDRLHAQQALFMRFLLGFIRKHHQPWLVRHVLLGTRIWCGAFFSSSNKTDM